MKFPRIELWGILFILFLFISMTAFSNQLVDLKIRPKDGSIDIVLCFDTLPTEYSTESDISFENFQIKFPNYTSGLLYRNLQVWISPIYEINVETQDENLKLLIRLVFPRKPKIRMEGKSVILNFKRSTKRADFIFPDWDIRMVIRYISEMLGISMIVDPNLNLGGKVSMNLRNITAEDAFIYLLKTYDDLGYVILPDGTIFLSDFNNLVKRFGDKVLVWRVYDFSDYSESAKETIRSVIDEIFQMLRTPTERLIIVSPKLAETAAEKVVTPRFKLINITTAPVEDLMKLPEIGEQIARNIVAYRSRNPLTSLEDLLNVSGIGEKKLEALRAVMERWPYFRIETTESYSYSVPMIPKESKFLVFMKARLQIHTKFMNLISQLAEERVVKRSVKVSYIDSKKLSKIANEIKKLFDLDSVDVLKETGYLILKGKVANVEKAVNYISNLMKEEKKKRTAYQRKKEEQKKKEEERERKVKTVIINLSSPLDNAVIDTIKKAYPKAKIEVVKKELPAGAKLYTYEHEYYSTVPQTETKAKSVEIPPRTVYQALITGTDEEIEGIKKILDEFGYLKEKEETAFIPIDPARLEAVLQILGTEYPEILTLPLEKTVLMLKGPKSKVKTAIDLINKIEGFLQEREGKVVRKVISIDPKAIFKAKDLIEKAVPEVNISIVPEIGLMVLRGVPEKVSEAVKLVEDYIEEGIGYTLIKIKGINWQIEETYASEYKYKGKEEETLKKEEKEKAVPVMGYYPYHIKEFVKKRIEEFLAFIDPNVEVYYFPETSILLLRGPVSNLLRVKYEIEKLDQAIYMDMLKKMRENEEITLVVPRIPLLSMNDLEKIILVKYPEISFLETSEGYVIRGKRLEALRARDEIEKLRKEITSKKIMVLGISEDIDMETVKKIIDIQTSGLTIIELGRSKILLKGDELELNKIKKTLSDLGLLGKVERKRTVRLYETEDIDFEEAKKLLNIYFPKLTVDYLEKAKMIVLVGSSDDVAGAVAVLKKMEPKYIRKEEEGEEKLKGMIKINPDGTFDLSIRDMTVEEVFRYLADKLGKNVMFGIPMEEKLVIDSKGLRWEDFLKLLEKNFGYVFEEVAGVLTVKKRETAPKPEGKKYIYKVGYNINEIKSLVEYFGGSAYVDEKNNLLIVTGIDEEQKKKLDEFIEELSAPPPQVSIEARMVDKNLTDSILKDLGIEIAMTNPTVKVSKDGVNIYTGVMSELEFAKFMEKFTETLQASATLNANKSDSQGETLSSPHIMTLSGNAAKILVGQRVPYIVSVGEEQEALQFIDIGMELNITPYVRADGTIELDVSAKVSNVVSWKKGRNGEDLPVESTREARTKVVIKDGETLVIGGLTTKDQSDSISKLPILGDLPFVGQLFRTVSKRDEKRELVIFITAKIAKR